MVKLSIKNEKEEKKEPSLRIGLEQDGDDVCITGTDNEGLTWNLLVIKSNGTFSRVGCVSECPGLQVDEDGSRIKEKIDG